jgi:DNA polymerase
VLKKPSACAGCPAAKTGRGFVPAEGPPEAEIAILGQGPGETECYQARPFVGPSGFTLDRWLVRAGLERHTLHVSNVVWCWLPGNRAPTHQEVAYCREHHWEPALNKLPRLKVIVPVGVPAMKALYGGKVTMNTAGLVMEVVLGEDQGV